MRQFIRTRKFRVDEIINVQNEPCLGASVCNEVAKISVNYNTLNCFINQIKGVM